VLPLVEDVPDSVERETYRQRLARLLHVDERALIGARPPAPSQRARPRRTPAASAPATQAVVKPTLTKEGYCLGILLCKPELIFVVDRALQEAGLARLAADDFHQTDYQVLFRLLQESTEQDEQEPATYIHGRLTPILEELSERLTKDTGPDEPNQERLVEHLLRNILLLRDFYLKENLNQLRFLQEETQEQGELRSAPYIELVQQHALVRRALDQALGLSSNH
jgi:DNA primase